MIYFIHKNSREKLISVLFLVIKLSSLKCIRQKCFGENLQDCKTPISNIQTKANMKTVETVLRVLTIE